MSTVFLGQDIWPKLTKAVRGCSVTCYAAVAYFGKGASKLLPLRKGSSLVVDASECAVKSGQTHPTDLLALLNKGVHIFSVPNLHAKVFVLGRAAYVGSPNVSYNSAAQLVEAVIRTTELKVVKAAREFVQGNCLHQLTPKAIAQLNKLYRPPRIPGGKRGKKSAKETSRRPTLPRLHLVKLKLEYWPQRDRALYDAALPVAKKRREHPRSYQLDDFRWTGDCPYRRGDVVVQVTDEGSGTILVSPPGNVLHVRTRRDPRRRVSFIYLELPSRRRRPIKSLVRVLGRNAQKRMRGSGLIRNAAFAQALLNAWSK